MSNTDNKNNIDNKDNSSPQTSHDTTSPNENDIKRR